MSVSLEILIENCLKDKREYQEQLYRSYADKMFNVALTYAIDDDEACDILQESFIKVFRNLKKYNFEGSFEGWIRRIVVNTALEACRKRKRYSEIIADAKYDGTEYQKNVFNDFNVADIIKMVNQLPTKAGLILKLYAIEGYSHQEIAEQLSISTGTSKSQLNRARAMLQDKLASL